tara:strand:- start:480 stop:911 length:432 start_codon:yes stop_codon:yes gene_type:complete
MIEYQKILDKNMLNVLKDVLRNIKNHGLNGGNHLYITFLTNQNKVIIPSWLKKKYPEEMTIVIQYEYYDIEVNKNYFSINLSFDNIKTNLQIGYDSIISFADPSANFGLILKKRKIKKKFNKDSHIKNKETDNVINFENYKKD